MICGFFYYPKVQLPSDAKELRGSGGSNPSFSAESSKSCFLRFMEAGCFLIYIINRKGEMLEWLKRHAWKACKPLKGFAGSNPAFSAKS